MNGGVRGLFLPQHLHQMWIVRRVKSDERVGAAVDRGGAEVTARQAIAVHHIHGKFVDIHPPGEDDSHHGAARHACQQHCDRRCLCCAKASAKVLAEGAIVFDTQIRNARKLLNNDRGEQQ